MASTQGTTFSCRKLSVTYRKMGSWLTIGINIVILIYKLFIFDRAIYSLKSSIPTPYIVGEACHTDLGCKTGMKVRRWPHRVELETYRTAQYLRHEKSRTNQRQPGQLGRRGKASCWILKAVYHFTGHRIAMRTSLEE